MSDQQPSVPVQELQIPEFKSNIPEYILKNIEKEGGSDGEHLKYILEALSVLQQQSNWQTEMLAKTYKQTLKTNGRTNRLEERTEKTDIEISKIKEELGENRESLTDIKGIRTLLSKRWFLLGAALIAIFVLFFIYPYLLATTTYKDVIEMLKHIF